MRRCLTENMIVLAIVDLELVSYTSRAREQALLKVRW